MTMTDELMLLASTLRSEVADDLSGSTRIRVLAG